MNKQGISDNENAAPTSQAVSNISDSTQKGWWVISLIAITVMLICIILDRGGSAIGASMVFATS
jgi:hypothetical protein